MAQPQGDSTTSSSEDANAADAADAASEEAYGAGW